MQTAFKITNNESGTPYHWGNRMHRHQPGNGTQKKKKIATARSGNDFLMGRILPIAPDYYIETGKDTNISVTTKENFDFLYRSALNYTRLMGVTLPFKEKKSCPRINIIELYKTLDTFLPEHINLETRDGKLFFCIYQFHNWPDYKLYWIPLDFTEKLPRELKRITLEFLRRFIRYHSIQHITESSYYEMAFEYLKYYKHYNEEAPQADIKHYSAVAKSYEKGKIHRMFERMKGKSFCTDLVGKIQICPTRNENEHRLLKLIKEGMELISPGSPHIMQYHYDWAYEKSPDFLPPGLEVQIMLGYSAKDALCKEMENCFNWDCQETYAISPVTTLYLTPETDKILKLDNYPEKFCKWLNSFMEHIINNF